MKPFRKGDVVVFLKPMYTHEVGHLAILRENGFLECGETCGVWCYSKDKNRKYLEVIDHIAEEPQAQTTGRMWKEPYCIGVDVSGSMEADEINFKLHEHANWVLNADEVVYFDATVVHTAYAQNLACPIDAFYVKQSRCYGGTDFQSFYEHMREHKLQHAMVITDGQTPLNYPSDLHVTLCYTSKYHRLNDGVRAIKDTVTMPEPLPYREVTDEDDDDQMFYPGDKVEVDGLKGEWFVKKTGFDDCTVEQGKTTRKVDYSDMTLHTSDRECVLRAWSFSAIGRAIRVTQKADGSLSCTCLSPFYPCKHIVTVEQLLAKEAAGKQAFSSMGSFKQGDIAPEIGDVVVTHRTRMSSHEDWDGNLGVVVAYASHCVVVIVGSENDDGFREKEVYLDPSVLETIDHMDGFERNSPTNLVLDDGVGDLLRGMKVEIKNKPQTQPVEFEVGDRVEYTKEIGGFTPVETRGTIFKVYQEEPKYEVRFDGSKGSPGPCCWSTSLRRCGYTGGDTQAQPASQPAPTTITKDGWTYWITERSDGIHSPTLSVVRQCDRCHTQQHHPVTDFFKKD